MKNLFQLILIIMLALPCHAAVVPIQRQIFTTNTFDAGIVGGSIPYFDYPSGKFVGTTLAYTNGILYDSSVGFLDIFRTNATGQLLLNLEEGGPSGPSIQGYSGKFVVANTNLTLDVLGPFSIRLRINNSNAMEAVSGGVSLNGKTNIVSDDGSVLTFNGNPIGSSLQSFYYGGQYGFGASSIIITNARISNLTIGTTDIFTTPAGKRFLVEGIKVATTNATSTTAYALLKTNGAYYRFGANSTLNTQAVVGLGVATGDNFLFEENEAVAVNVTQVGANVTVSGLLFSTNVPFFCPRLFALTTSNQTVYTCPSGKCAVNPAFPNPVTAGGSALLGYYINDSGGSRVITFYVVPSGGSAGSSTIQLARTVSDKITASLLGSVMFPGDSLVVHSDTNTATQWVRFTVAEIPFP
jgi:hypothetical protein